MGLKNIPLEKKDFDDAQWQRIVDACDQKECHYYSSLFFSKAREAEAENDEKKHEIFALLGCLTSMMLEPNSTTEPFRPLCENFAAGTRSAIIDDFTDNHLQVLSEIVTEIRDPELKARVADILWIRKRDYRMAELAIPSYTDSASKLEHPDQWTQCVERIERALRLATSLGRRSGQFDKVVAHIERMLKRLPEADSIFLNKLMNLLLDHQVGDEIKYAELSEKLAIRDESEKDWFRARPVWESAARWQARAKNSPKERAARLKAAETHVKEAEAAIAGDSPSHMLAAGHIQKAIEAYRRIGGERDRVEELHSALLDYEQKSFAEMGTISTEIDLSEHVENAIADVSHKSTYDALFTLAQIISSPKVGHLRERVQEAIKKYPFQHLVSAVKVDENGKVVAQMPNVLSSNPEEVESALRAKMHQQAELDYHIDVQAVIEPARNQINLEHQVRIIDILPIVSDNPLVPEGREQIFARGLHAGLAGDFLTAIHLLIPQFENSVRHLLKQQGLITSGLSSDGIQEEWDLNKTLYMPQTVNIFGEDLVFDLQGLLVNRYGANLRNKMAHGLMSHDDFYSSEVVYLWWLMLRLCCWPTILRIRSMEAQPSRNQTSGEENDEEESTHKNDEAG